jgi:hypothetical protein
MSKEAAASADPAAAVPVARASTTFRPSEPLSPDEARALAKEAYIYGFPIVDNYRIQYSYFVDRRDPEFKAPWNTIFNNARVYTPEDKAIQSPNSDTPYSQLGADLRSEPLVLSIPAVERGRYYALQFIDQYTFNFSYLGSRSTGSEAGYYLLAGPRWFGAKPKDISAVIHCETEFAFVLYRTQLFGPADIDRVKEIQAGYRVKSLSQFLGIPSPARPPEVKFVKPLAAEEERTSLEAFNVLNFVLQFCPTHSSEKTLMARFARLGIRAGNPFDAGQLSPQIREAIEDGIGDAWRAYGGLEKKMATGEITSASVFGSRTFLRNNYLYRMLAAADGIYGNSREEAIYPTYLVDSTGQKLDGAKYRYRLRFAPGQLPPVLAFWSLTLYELPSRLLSMNPLNRYLINSAMLPVLKRDSDGGLTIYVQHYSPGISDESNWLPAPNGPFMMALRLYSPKSAAFNGRWKMPPLLRVA